MSTQWVYPAGSLRRDNWDLVIDGSLADWQYTGLRTATLAAGESVSFENDGVESIVLPLEGSFTVTWSDDDNTDAVTELAGRASIITQATDSLYLGVGARASISGSGRVAVAQARATQKFAAVHVPADSVPALVRGTGRMSREVRNFGMPASVHGAQILACEVVTPGGNWSSYPAHKHDVDEEGVETELEEIYYFEVRSALGDEPGVSTAEGAPSYALFSSRGSEGRELVIDTRVSDGDVVLVPHGYHGPIAVPPGVYLYQLNVMAGPGPRQWLAVNEDGADSINELVSQEGADPRLPVTR